MTIRLQILQNQPEHIWNQRITKPEQLSLHPSQVLKRDTGKGDRFKADWQARKGARLKTWQWQVLATVFFLVRKADMEGNWFFFSPLWEMSFSTRPWQFSNDGRLDTIKCDTRKAWLRSFFFLLKNVSDNMSAWSQLQLRDQFATRSALQHSAPETAQK